MAIKKSKYLKRWEAWIHLDRWAEMLPWLKKWEEAAVPVDRPDWDEYFLCMAKLVSMRSMDAQTKCGCVLVDAQHRVLSVGYNGFPSKLDDDLLPNTRPYKYKWVLHSERNALHNCLVRPEGATAYVTSKPCLECLKALHAEGIKDVCYVDCTLANMLQDDEEEMAVFDAFVAMGEIRMRAIKVNPDRAITALRGLGEL